VAAEESAFPGFDAIWTDVFLGVMYKEELKQRVKQ